MATGDIVSQYAAEWIEIGRTLTANSQAIDELRYDLRMRTFELFEKCTKRLIMMEESRCSSNKHNNDYHSSNSDNLQKEMLHQEQGYGNDG
ncbi:hypothetical protein BLOT_009877 [Blomia tropicalis]|nr:hypothetical protein BLOT_009877 [Blomia tropicalis]